MEGINQWLVELNKNTPVWFGVVTVLTMAVVGVLMAVMAEIILKISGISGYLDLRGEVCPFTLVKVKLALEKISSGEVAVVILDKGPPMENVPRSIKDEGYQIIKVERVNGSFKLWIRKG